MAVIVKRWDDAGAAVLNGTAGSLIAVLDAVLVTAAGWTKAFTGTNKAVYRAPVGGNRFYLRVDDTVTTYARIIGYETMSDVDTGTGPFPTDAQFTGGLYLVKSTAADTTPRAWLITVSDRLFHLWRDSSTTAPTYTSASSYAHGICFGDFKSYTTGDAYGSILIGSSTSAATTGETMAMVGSAAAVQTGHYAPRSYTQIGASTQLGKMGDAALYTSGVLGSSNVLPFPNASDGGLHMAPIRITQPTTIRGTLPGMWNYLHPVSSFNVLDTFTGSGTLAGKTFIIVAVDGVAGYALETSNTWDV